jgi:hypothetical protein
VYLDKVETTNLGRGVANICEHAPASSAIVFASTTNNTGMEIH